MNSFVSSPRSERIVILGQGIAGSVLAWQLHWQSKAVTLVNSSDRPCASTVAAGLIMPISGKKFTLQKDYASKVIQAEQFYSRVEDAVVQNIYQKISVFRSFVSQGDRDFFLNERYGSVRDLVELIHGPEGRPVGFLMEGARLNVPAFLRCTAQFFRREHQYIDADLDPATGISVHEKHVQISSMQLTADRIVFCQGASGVGNPWFPEIPDHPLRGEILKIQLENPLAYDAVVGDYWLTPDHAFNFDQSVPSSATTYLLGATYDRKDLTSETTDAGRNELLSALPVMVDGPCRVKGHVSGIRAGTRRREVVMEVHHQYPHVGILNGLGSYGSLLAPWAAEQFLSIQQKAIGKTQATTPLIRRGNSLTSKAHTIVRRAVVRGDAVLDATAGNGYDTVFLAGLTETQNVFAIDIQQTAITNTRERLREAGLAGVQLLHGDHAKEIERIITALPQEITGFGAVMFNLGYLPGSNKIDTTQAESTVKALRLSEKILRPCGVITVIAYRGHSGGQEEAAAVLKLAEEFNDCRTDVIESESSDPTSPVLIVFRKMQCSAGNEMKTTSQP